MSKTDILKSTLAAKGLNYVGTRGNVKGPVCLIGEAPGADEDKQGVPFVGASGRELDRMLGEVGIHNDSCWWTNPYKVRPPDNKIDRLSEFGIGNEVFIDQFLEELHEHKPTVIVPCGATPLGVLCPSTINKRTQNSEISKWKGSLLRSPLLPWDHYVIPTYHPAYLFRNWGDRPVAVLALEKAATELKYWQSNGRLQPLPDRQLITDPNFHDACDFLRSLLCSPLPIASDIENIGVYKGKYKTKQRNRLPYVIGLCNTPNLAMSLGFSEYSPSQTEILWVLIDRLLASKRQIGQNYYTHDAPWLEYIGFSPAIELLDDTLVSHHVLWPELSHKLEFQTFQYTREPYYKDEGKNWSVKERQVLKKYNCKDVCVDLEIYNAHQAEFQTNPELGRFYRDYAMPLAHAFFHISKRGIFTDSTKLKALDEYLTAELRQSVSNISLQLAGAPVIAVKPPDVKQLPPGTVNLSSPDQVKEIIRKLGMKVPKKHGQGETTDEESLNELFAETGHPFLKDLLRVRELNKIQGTYVDTELENGVFYSAYFVTGTVTGRRSSRANFLGLGGNGQNQPHHSDLGKKYLECMVARPGRIFVSCDQVQAEDWIVNAIIADVSGDRSGLEELINGVDRHSKLASFIFTKPVDQCGKGTPMRFMGKKVRHAGNYDVYANELSSAFSKENFQVAPSTCEWLLTRFHLANPGIRKVFHKYIQDQLTETATLTTPLGRVRQFFDLRPYVDNKKIYKEAYAQIPQSTVGDNTGLAVLYIEQNAPGYVVADGHDSITLEVPDTFESVVFAVELLRKGFDRKLRFPRGLEIQIPIEFEIGYDLQNKKTCANSSLAGLNATYETLKGLRSPLNATTYGQQLQSSVAL